MTVGNSWVGAISGMKSQEIVVVRYDYPPLGLRECELIFIAGTAQTGIDRGGDVDATMS